MTTYTRERVEKLVNELNGIRNEAISNLKLEYEKIIKGEKKKLLDSIEIKDGEIRRLNDELQFLKKQIQTQNGVPSIKSLQGIIRSARETCSRTNQFGHYW